MSAPSQMTIPWEERPSFEILPRLNKDALKIFRTVYTDGAGNTEPVGIAYSDASNKAVVFSDTLSQDKADLAKHCKFPGPTSASVSDHESVRVASLVNHLTSNLDQAQDLYSSSIVKQSQRGSRSMNWEYHPFSEWDVIEGQLQNARFFFYYEGKLCSIEAPQKLGDKFQVTFDASLSQNLPEGSWDLFQARQAAQDHLSYVLSLEDGFPDGWRDAMFRQKCTELPSNAQL